MSHLFKSLQYPNFRFYFFGQSVSLIGSWMQRVAISWLVYNLTGSAFILGLFFFASQIPTFLFSPYGGVIADRYNKYKILLIAQIASMIQAVLLAIIVLAGYQNLFAIIFLTSILGVINAFETPARQSLFIHLIDDKKDLPNAIALNSTMINVGRLLGPTVAGIILAMFGEGCCFLINAISFIAVIFSLLAMRLPKETAIISRNKYFWKDFYEGYNYVVKNKGIANIILMIELICLLMMPFTALLPILSTEILHGDAGTFGFINSASGLGALSAAITLGILKSKASLNKLMIASSFIFSISLLLVGFTDYLPSALICMVFAGFGMMLCLAGGNTLLQMNVSNSMRGRVLGFYTMAIFGMQPIGNFLIGILAEEFGVRVTIGLEGLAGIIISTIFVSHFIPKNKVVAFHENTLEDISAQRKAVA